MEYDADDPAVQLCKRHGVYFPNERGVDDCYGCYGCRQLIWAMKQNSMEFLHATGIYVLIGRLAE